MAPRDKTTGTAALALAEDSTQVALAAISTNTVDALAGVDGIKDINIDDDGLGPIEREDIKLPAWVFNFKGTQPNGDPILANTFYNTLTGEIRRELNAIPLKRHKTNEWRVYNEAEAKNEVMCRSFDRGVGRVMTECTSRSGAKLTEGTERPCTGCPDSEWYVGTGKDGRPKRMKNCGSVNNVFLIDLPELTPSVIRFRRTSLRVIQEHLSKHHIGRRPLRNETTGKTEMVNYPLYSFAAKFTLKMSEDRQPYAIPVIERGVVLPSDLFRQAAETVPYVNNVLLGELNKIVDAPDQAHDDEATPDTSFDTAAMAGNSMAGGEGQDFTT